MKIFYKGRPKKDVGTDGILVNELVYNPIRPSSPSASSIGPANLHRWPGVYQDDPQSDHQAHNCRCDS
jgi:hypothetical protein